MTGCTRGCGRALAEAVAAAGHTVAGCGTNAARVREVAEALGEPHLVEVVDVADDAAVARWAAHVLENYGPPDLLVNNAAVIHPNAPLWEIAREDFNAVIDVNIKGVANVLRHFLPAMVERRRGVVVNISSGWGRSTSPEVSGYCASKWAIEGLTQSLAQELPRGMAAVALNPGIIDTEMLRSCFGSGASSYPRPEVWVKSAAPFILKLGPEDNGKALTVPGARED